MLISVQLWLFKPRLPISYTVTKHYAIPGRASISAAKVLFRLLGPAESSVDLPSYAHSYTPSFTMNVDARIS